MSTGENPGSRCLRLPKQSGKAPTAVDSRRRRGLFADVVRRTYALGGEIGQRLKEARAKAGLTVRQLEIAAHIDKTSIVAIEFGRVRNPGVGTIADLAKALGVSAEWLAYGSGSMT